MIKRNLLVMGLAVLLSACGFQLRGTGTNQLTITELDVSARNAYGDTVRLVVGERPPETTTTTSTTTTSTTTTTTTPPPPTTTSSTTSTSTTTSTTLPAPPTTTPAP